MEVKEFACAPGEGISGIEKIVRPLCIELARASRKFQINGTEKQWFIQLLSCALDGNIPRFTGWHKDLVDWGANEAEFGAQTKAVEAAQPENS